MLELKNNMHQTVHAMTYIAHISLPPHCLALLLSYIFLDVFLIFSSPRFTSKPPPPTKNHIYMITFFHIEAKSKSVPPFSVHRRRKLEAPYVSKRPLSIL